MSELWIDPEVSLIMSVGEPSDFLSDDAVISDNDTIVSLPGFHLVILICQTSDKVLGSMLFTVKFQQHGSTLVLRSGRTLVQNPARERMINSE